jgi:hypothetical protein
MRRYCRTLIASVSMLLVAACSGLPMSQGPDRSSTGENTASKQAGAAQPGVGISGDLPGDWKPPSHKELLEAAGAKLGGEDGLLAGGPHPDGIPAIDRPQFLPIAKVNWVGDQEPVGVLVERGTARAYPLQILMWHEIVNDTLGGRAVTVTYCPLCNSVIAFDRNLNGQRLSFGTSGMLWRSDLVMYDRQTLSLWSQMEGRAIYGNLADQQLQFLPISLVSWAEFKKAYPHGEVLSRSTGHDREYGSNPYYEYDSGTKPFLFDGTPDRRLPPMERVVGVLGTKNDKPRAWSYALLGKERVIQEQDIVIFYLPGMASAADTPRIADGRDVGTTGVFSPVVEGRRLNFVWNGREMVDTETESTWDVFGRALTGPLSGQQLAPVVKFDVFWFAWAVFHPKTELRS